MCITSSSASAITALSLSLSLSLQRSKIQYSKPNKVIARKKHMQKMINKQTTNSPPMAITGDDAIHCFLSLQPRQTHYFTRSTGDILPP
ncbi:hypothetical protein M441DRAFT_58352 [Trichoderma asperellum CBS 433.97]|uniref:Secreted protein n=1 Tax=Trichoderma asperellum (strain ATCC 204424 / CBS 433.97 / NBRC 101777) TaxID=1042311 RepID=A0A2T3Z7W6_TRIA4|nr:hypothetical protein M441DRAFT_58352 [Trichoderma asperellum CBS 433.97]PTB40882.1 hypothetical protein M441DRAFT_58352 [Trichoderma asperellum CBS 433.97]